MQLMASVAQFWFALLFQNLMLLFSMSLGTQNGTDPSEAAAYSTVFKRKPSLPYIYFFSLGLALNILARHGIGILHPISSCHIPVNGPWCDIAML